MYMMMYLIKLLQICGFYLQSVTALLALFLVPQWYFESTLFAHALKTPLSTLSLSLAEAQQSVSSQRKVQQALRRAESARRQLQLLLFDQHQAATAAFNVKDQAHQVTRWFVSYGHTIHLLIQHEQLHTVSLRGNHLLFQQLLEILIDNGLKASRAGSPIVVALSLEKKQLQIGVHDFGSGMSRFDALVRLLKGCSFHHDRWGIGLVCAWRIAAYFHGRIEIQSRKTVGTNIICTLPLGLE